MDFLKVFDAYSLRARLAPAIIAGSPVLVALMLLIPWKSFEIPNVIATGAALVLLFAIADFARSQGRAIESKLYAELGGMPSITLFRRNDPTIDDVIKERFRSFLAKKLGVPAPSLEAEQSDQFAGDSFYEQCGVWLRQNTRDTKKFVLLFNENVTYGFRRNLFSIKRLTLALDLAVMTISLLLLWRGSWDFGKAFLIRTIVVLVVTSVHTSYIFYAVRKKDVCDAARAYGRELILSCEAFLSVPASSKGKSAPRPRRVSE